MDKHCFLGGNFLRKVSHDQPLGPDLDREGPATLAGELLRKHMTLLSS